MNCPTCGTDQIQRQRIAYESGTTSGTATSRGTINSGFLATASTRSTTTSTHQTSMAIKCAPPAFPKTRNGLIMVGVTVVCMFGLGGVTAYWWIAAVVINYVVITQWRQPIDQRNLSTYKLQMRRYEQSWVCHKCGEMWCEDDHTVPEMAAEVPAFAGFGSESSL
jgi:hypothetical protein